MADKEPRYRRLACDMALINRGMSAAEAARECNKRAIQLGYSCTFNERAVSQFINNNGNFSRNRLYVLADVLGVRDTKEIDEKFKEPDYRYIGLQWVGEFGTVYSDYKKVQ